MFLDYFALGLLLVGLTLVFYTFIYIHENGRLRWRDLHVHERIPYGQAAEDHVEFSFPMR